MTFSKISGFITLSVVNIKIHFWWVIKNDQADNSVALVFGGLKNMENYMKLEIDDEQKEILLCIYADEEIEGDLNFSIWEKILLHL